MLPRLLHRIEELLCVHVHIPCTPLDYSEAGPCISLCRLSLGNRGEGRGGEGGEWVIEREEGETHRSSTSQ